MQKKNAQIANFNVVFGDDERPMLDYFDTVIYPAFTSGISKKSDDVEYLLVDIQLLINFRNELYFTGKIVKKTILEVLTDMDEDRILIEKDEKHSSAPYSTFAICLKNHRMLFLPNQKGSPTLRGFKSIITYILRQYIATKNKDLEERLPEPIVNVVGIPNSKSLREVLKSVEKVNTLTLKFYPLNGDMDLSGLFPIMSTDLRRTVGSKTGQIMLNSPKSIEGIVEVLEQAGGTINPIIRATTKDKAKVTLKDEQVLEKFEMEFDENVGFSEESEMIVQKTSRIETLAYTNEEHEEIYNRNVARIIELQK